MNHSIVRRLIAKDLYLYRWFIVIPLVTGLAALAFTGTDGVSGDLGQILFVTAAIIPGIFIVMYGILKERQFGSLLFVLSLPISPMQYTWAKIGAALIAFLIPWIALTGTALGLMVAFDPPSVGRIPLTIAMMVLFLANFCVLLAVVHSTGAEHWAVTAIVVTNISVPVFLNVAPRLPSIAAGFVSPVPVWSSTILAVLAVEAAVIALSFGLTFYIQSRKRDFVQ